MNATPTEIDLASKAVWESPYGRDLGGLLECEEVAAHLIAALSEHYHLLPKAEVVVEYAVAWTADNGNVIPFFNQTNQTVWRPGADRELAELQADIQKNGGNDADRYYVAQRLQSRWAAADVAEVKP